MEQPEKKGTVNEKTPRAQEQNKESSLFSRVIAVIRRDWNTIPNYFSYFRLALIPAFIWLYVVEQYSAAAVIIVMSWVSDVADGFIARRFNMTTEFGKVLDPIADKLTQGSIFVCLSIRYKLALALVCVIAVKEITMLIVGMIVFKRSDRVDSAAWYGKLATGVVATTAIILVLAPVVWPDMPIELVNGMLIASIALAAFAFLMYMIRFVFIFREIGQDNNGVGGE